MGIGCNTQESERGMTAYDLAEELDWHWDNDCRSPFISKSADMLREQADLLEQASRFIREQGLEGQWIIWAAKEKSSIEGKGRIG